MDKYYTLEEAEAISKLCAGCLASMNKSVAQLVGVLDKAKLEDFSKKRFDWSKKLKTSIDEVEKLKTIGAEAKGLKLKVEELGARVKGADEMLEGKGKVLEILARKNEQMRNER